MHDNKRLAVAEAIVDTLESMRLAFPKVSATERRELIAARAALDAGKKP
jgi:hypothetical protein